MKIRAFFAIDLPEESKSRIATLTSVLKKITPASSIRWVDPKKSHLTLQFLGAIEREDTRLLLENVKKSLSNSAVFTLNLSHIIPFPSEKHPKVIALDVTPHEPLIQLAEKIGEGICQSGYPIQKRALLPHITLGKILHFNEPIPLPTLDLLEEKITVSSVVLFQSEQSTHGTHYTVLGTISLNPKID